MNNMVKSSLQFFKAMHFALPFLYLSFLGSAHADKAKSDSNTPTASKIQEKEKKDEIKKKIEELERKIDVLDEENLSRLLQLYLEDEIMSKETESVENEVDQPNLAIPENADKKDMEKNKTVVAEEEKEKEIEMPIADPLKEDSVEKMNQADSVISGEAIDQEIETPKLDPFTEEDPVTLEEEIRYHIKIVPERADIKNLEQDELVESGEDPVETIEEPKPDSLKEDMLGKMDQNDEVFSEGEIEQKIEIPKFDSVTKETPVIFEDDSVPSILVLPISSDKKDTGQDEMVDPEDTIEKSNPDVLMEDAREKMEQPEPTIPDEASKMEVDSPQEGPNTDKVTDKSEIMRPNDNNLAPDHVDTILGKGMIPVKGENYIITGIGIELIWIEQLQLWVGKFEVTNGEYKKFDSEHKIPDYEGHKLNGDRQPVVYVSLEDALKFCGWLNHRELKEDRLSSSMEYRLPTGEEWIKIAKCGDERKYPWGDEWPPRYGNYDADTEFDEYKISGYKDQYIVSCPVEDSGRNEWNLFGVGGNALEWTTETKDEEIIVRGGSWYHFNRYTLENKFKSNYHPEIEFESLGFRIILSP